MFELIHTTGIRLENGFFCASHLANFYEESQVPQLFLRRNFHHRSLHSQTISTSPLSSHSAVFRPTVHHRHEINTRAPLPWETSSQQLPMNPHCLPESYFIPLLQTTCELRLVQYRKGTTSTFLYRHYSVHMISSYHN